MGFLDELGLEELIDFFADCCIPFGVEHAALLNNRIVVGSTLSLWTMTDESMLGMSSSLLRNL